MESNQEEMEHRLLIPKEDSQVKTSKTKLFIIGAVAALVGVAGVVHSGRSPESFHKKTETELSESNDLSFIIQSQYGANVPGSGMYPWKLITEPHKVSTLIVQEPAGETLLEGQEVSYHWHIIEDKKLSWGNSMEHTFTSTGLKEVHVARYITDVSTGEQTQTHHLVNEVAVKYVKRELRLLSDDDREGFFMALQAVYQTSTDDGIALFGDNFVGIDDLVKAHLQGAGQKECDHWHDGAGIMVHHLSFTLKLELALQAVNPSVTVPYWEYTIDSVQLGSDWRTSKIFSDDWFGNSGNSLDDNHFVKQGRWGYTTITKDEKFEITNAYGLLRSPWNVNPVTYVTRFDNVLGQKYMGGSLPTCDIVKSCFDSDTLSGMNTCLNGATHGPLHILLGGQWGVKLDEMTSKLIGSAQLLLFKTLWRRGFSRCPTSQTDLDNGFTSCACSSDAIEAAGGAYEVLTTHSGILHWMAATSNGAIEYNSDTDKFELPTKTEGYESATWNSFLTSLCDPGSVGEMYTSSAPYDPSFWVLHTTAERLLSYKRLLSMESDDNSPTSTTSFDETWGYDHIDSDSDIGVTCDWTNVDESDVLSMPTCIKGECSGHAADDVIPFDLSGVSSDLSATTTNQEFYDWLSPTNDDLTYVYDSFNYEHCESAGVTIG